VSGCTDPSACNYNPLANIDDNNCILPGSPCDDGNALTINDSLDVNCNCVGLDITGLLENNIQFDIYPNPSSTAFTIETNFTQEKTIYITDLQGKVLLQFNSNKATESINCAHLANGTYLVQIKTNAMQRTKTLHVQH
jgi:hypothetical protein